MNNATLFIIIAVIAVLVLGVLSMGRERRPRSGRPPIEIDFDRAKRMENKLR
ncbi:MAG: hypothetical protein AB7D51_12345 [Desulfovibrionaceae bacterium]|jgi:hypothetical protein